MRQLANASASVTLARGYEPFGDPLSSAGTGTSIFQFTGQQVDGTGLVYLRARYYSGAFGRFLSRDVWQGDPSQPMSYNVWLYVVGNPVNNTDPSGHEACRDDECPDPLEYYNLTGWLVRTMAANAASPEVSRIRELNRMAGPVVPHALMAVLEATLRAAIGDVDLDWDCLLGIVQEELRENPYRDQAYDAWEALVRGQARWDFKHGILSLLGDSIRLCAGSSCQWFDSDVPGNIHYGYVGRQAGFLPAELHLGAGQAQRRDDPATSRSYALFDDPIDYRAVEMGISLHGAFGSHLGVTEFQAGLLLYGAHLRIVPPPVPPYHLYPYVVEEGLGPRYPVWFFEGGRYGQ